MPKLLHERVGGCGEAGLARMAMDARGYVRGYVRNCARLKAQGSKLKALKLKVQDSLPRLPNRARAQASPK